MRLGGALALLWLTAATARAEPTPITVAPFSGRCFDAARLAERVRARLDVPVAVGAPPRGSHQEVHVTERGEAITVEVTARDGRGDVVGSARRVVPAGTDCATALELTSLIVARAALPLSFESTGDSRPSTARHQGAHRAPSPPPASPAQEPEPEPAAPSATAPPTAPAAPTAPPPPPPPPRIIVRIVRPPPPRPEPGTIVLRTRGPDRAWVGELAAAAYGAFPLDGTGGDVPGGELAIGLRHRRFGLALRGAVEGGNTIAATSPAGPIALELRRAAITLEAHADVPVRVVAMRFVVGPSLPLWTVRPRGLPHPRPSVIVSAAVSARLLYHLDLGRFFLTAGIDASVALVREQLAVTGVGTLARTPIVQIGPILGLGVSL